MRTLAAFIPLFGATLEQLQSTAAVTGYLTDTLCGARGANHLHAEHARRSVASGKAQYALYDEKTRQLYILEDKAAAEQWLSRGLGKRVRITGTVSAPEASGAIRRAGQSLAPDAVATTAVNGEQRPVSGDASRTGGASTTDPSASNAASGQVRVQQHRNALDTSTPVAGVLTISAVEPAPR